MRSSESKPQVLIPSFRFRRRLHPSEKQEKDKDVPQKRDASSFAKLFKGHPRLLDAVAHLCAVDLFSMFTTWTRRLTLDNGLAGSFSLVLPYPTATRSEPAMANLSTR